MAAAAKEAQAKIPAYYVIGTTYGMHAHAHTQADACFYACMHAQEHPC
jgi:hypothetical protein